MKTSIQNLIALVSGLLLMAGVQGCYTQMGTVQDQPGYSEQRHRQEAPSESGDDSSAEGEYSEDGSQVPEDVGQDWDSQVYVGMDYYYPSTWWPSVGFSFAYNDPYYGWGSPYYGYGYGYPYYGYGYPYYGYGSPWYDPWYGYPAYCGYYPVAPVPWQNREFGSTRGSGNTRGSGSTRSSGGTMNASNNMRDGSGDAQMMDLPTGSGRPVVGGTAAGGAAAKRSGATQATKNSSTRTKSGTSRKDVTKKMERKLSPAQRRAQADRDMRRLYRDRGSVSGSSRSRSAESGTDLNSAPSSGGASPRSGSVSQPPRSSQPQRSSAPSVRSAPAPAPRSSAPAPSSGGSRGGGGGGGGRSPRP